MLRLFFCRIRGCKKAVSSFLIGKLHKAGTIFSQSHKSSSGFVQVAGH